MSAFCGKVFLQEHSYVRNCTYNYRYGNEFTKVAPLVNLRIVRSLNWNRSLAGSGHAPSPQREPFHR